MNRKTKVNSLSTTWKFYRSKEVLPVLERNRLYSKVGPWDTLMDPYNDQRYWKVAVRTTRSVRVWVRPHPPRRQEVSRSWRTVASLVYSWGYHRIERQSVFFDHIRGNIRLWAFDTWIGTGKYWKMKSPFIFFMPEVLTMATITHNEKAKNTDVTWIYKYVVHQIGLSRCLGVSWKAEHLL